jgi:hypothetical protein
MSALRRFLAVSLVWLSATTGSAARADQIGISGDNLVELFTSKDPSRSTFAFGYVVGIAEAFNRLPKSNDGSGQDTGGWVCLPPYTTPMRIVEAVQQYFSQNPDLRGRLAGQLVVAALAQAFPCDAND